LCVIAALTPLEHDYLPGTAALMQAHLLREPLPAGGTEAFLRATLLDHPWADPELPSLVALDDDGAVVGFIASQPRRMLLGDRPVRAVLCSHLVVAPEARTSTVAVQLLRRLLSGPQELTFSDTAEEIVVRLWQTLRGDVDHMRALDWALVLSPARWAGAVARTLRGGRPGRDLVPVGALPLQAAGARLVARAHPAPDPEVRSEPLGIADAVEQLPVVTRGVRLRPDHDEAHLAAVLDLMERSGERVVRRLVRRREQALGWYVYAIRRGVARVVAVMTSARAVEAVVGALVDDARREGAGLLTGRAEPLLAEPLAQRMAVLGYARRPLLHTRDEDIRAALLSGSAVLPRLDAEWWVI
jgi:hypothetical protein